jgi:hypothetical protein
LRQVELGDGLKIHSEFNEVPVFYPQHSVGIGLDLQNFAGPIPQRGYLLEIAVCIDAGLAV